LIGEENNAEEGKAASEKEVSSSPEKLKGKDYLRKLERLHVELVKLQSQRGSAPASSA
jgi:hypothetical protein